MWMINARPTISPEEPRSLPTSGFHTVDPDRLVEEEELPDYKADRFYPVHLGEIFEERYQVLGKLGFGSSSTVWLARDLKDHQYVTLKVYVHTSAVHRELPVYQHISPYIKSATSHRGRHNIRQLLNSFTINGPDGKHIVLVFQAAQMSLRDMKVVFFPNGFDERFVKGAIIELLQALDFLHSYGKVVHTDVHSGNMLLGLYDSSLLRILEDAELKAPVARKLISHSRTIYLSRLSKPKEGPMLLSDFGETRIGPGPHPGDIMPLEYRAPETLLYVTWSYPVDIWSVGLTGLNFGMTNGEWLSPVPIPEGRTLESLETRLEDKEGFLRFIRRALTWMPEQRATARELLQDPWLLGKTTQGLGLSQSPVSTGSLFGQSTAEQPAQAQAQAQAPSLFAPKSNATGSLQPPSGLSIFGQTSSAQTGQTPGTTTVPPPSQPAYFSSLLEKGKKRPLSSFQNVSSVELPSLQLGLDDIRKSARGLGASGPRNAANKPVVTEHRILSSLTASGISPGQVLHDLHAFDTQTDANNAALQGVDSRPMREKIGHFGLKVQKLNEMRIQERTFPVLREFAEAQKVADTDVPKQLLEAYHALISITNEPASSVGYFEPGALRPRQFAKDYGEDSPGSVDALKMRRQIIAGSRKHLERTFYKELEEAIARNPREAQLGGVPTIINKIRAYIRLRAARKDLAPDGTELQMVNDDYCWILIFYLLRCGFIEEAAEYVSRDQGFRSMDYKFVTYMTTYAQHRRLPRDLQQKIGAEYQQRLRNAPENTIDPYRMACYKIIGRCDLTHRRLDGLGQGVEDWMWLQFALAREDTRAEEVAGDIFGLEDIKKDIVEIGQRVFPKGQETPGAYGIYFLLQILGGMFEQAIAYLGSYAPIDAVHFAIALDYYGLLRINFAALIMQYTREFRLGNVEAAIDYFTLICLNTDIPGELGKSQATVCHEALREFILETRDFAKLLGDIRSDGTRIKGVIEQRLKLINLDDQEEFLKAVTVQAAAVADDKGLTADAVLLYHLAEEYDNVVTILNRILSDAVAVPLGEAAIKIEPVKPRTGAQHQPPESAHAEPGSSLSLTSVDDPVVLAKNMISLYNTNALYYQKIHPINREACGLLLRMMETKAKVEAGQWAPALDDINNLQILPLTAQGSVNYVRSAVQAFTSLPPVIARNAGNLIMWSITCISRERERMYSGVYENDMRQTLVQELVVMAKDLMVFSGMIKYKLPPRVYETLAKAAGDIGLNL
ncbi:protein kinase domain-containing protein [Microsporum canis CBS 113480]|uniref:Protein kinase domain-containing protein n=1 Tax=Arthroderma otae (strain ATCC MYA-4605 / CBS 113480) TaxID=554155 RepID=C5FGW0_ARTOC|nr:protein kinase domain-containing protein [Microsporum canis CBS 113480]EEQ29995.1 protein kinase domain-containing protein [Microsporum canis CBS 113480]